MRPSTGPSVFARSDSFHPPTAVDAYVSSAVVVRCMPLTSSMPWAGVVLLAHVIRCSFPCLQGVIAHLVAIGCTCFKTVVTCGSLPNLSHRVGRSGGLPTPRLPLLVMARARVWAGGLAGPGVRGGVLGDVEVTGLAGDGDHHPARWPRVFASYASLTLEGTHLDHALARAGGMGQGLVVRGGAVHEQQILPRRGFIRSPGRT